MSRCFPFPPPGYEKKPRNSTEQWDLLAKEKHRERKHKKEKKDKEGGQSKERKDKDRSKDKHKEKDQKEKHKDRKRDRDKNRTSEDRRTEHLSEVHHEDRLRCDSRKAEESRDSKFTEDFGRRIRDDEKGAATRMVEDFSATAHKSVESMGASTDIGNESITSNKMVTDVTGAVQRRNEKLTSSFQKKTKGMGTAITMEKQKVTSSERVPDFNSAERRKSENLIHPIQKRIESMGTATSMEKQRAASNDKFGGFSSAEHRRNYATGRPTDNIPSLVQRRIEGKVTVDSMQKERAANNNMVSYSTGAAAKRNGGVIQPSEGRPLESLNPSVSRRIENIGTAPAMEKERSLFLNITGTEQRTDEQRRTDAMGPSVEKDTGKMTEGKEKTKEKKTEDGKREGHKDRDRKEKKRKEKDKDRHKEKKKEEKKREKSEHKHTKHDKLRESGVTDQIDNLINNTLTPYIEDTSTAGADGNTNKRKEFESNGFLHEPQHDARPNKLPRTGASSHPPVENGRLLEFVHNALPCGSAKLGAVNNTKIERDLDDNDNHLNGMMVAPSKCTLKPPVAPVVPPVPPVVPHIHVDSSKNDQLPLKPLPPKNIDQVPVKPPHPDIKYLSTIYSVPKAEELLESDDHEWLFSTENPRSNTNLVVDSTPPQVWATGLQIEAADVFALPYVIPF